MFIKITCILITEDLKIKRMRQRNDDEETIVRRLKLDAADKADIDWGGLEVINLQATTPLAEKVERILRAC